MLPALLMTAVLGRSWWPWAVPFAQLNMLTDMQATLMMLAKWGLQPSSPEGEIDSICTSFSSAGKLGVSSWSAEKPLGMCTVWQYLRWLLPGRFRWLYCTC